MINHKGKEYTRIIESLYCTAEINITLQINCCCCSVAQLCQLSVTPLTVAHQAPLFMAFPRQEYWSGLPFPSLGDVPDPGIKPMSPESLALAGGLRRHGFDPWIGKFPFRKEWQPTPVFLPGEFQEQRSLAGYSPWSCKELDTTY